MRAGTRGPLCECQVVSLMGKDSAVRAGKGADPGAVSRYAFRGALGVKCFFWLLLV